MKNKTTKTIPMGVAVCTAAAGALVLTSVILATLWYYLRFLPLLLTALILVLPAVINLLLLLPDGKTYSKGEKKPKFRRRKIPLKEFVKGIIPAVRRFCEKTALFVNVHRTHITIIASVLSILCINLLFWLKSGSAGAHNFGFWMPLIFAAVFVELIVIDKWTKYAKADIGGSREAVILENIHSITALCKIVTVVCAAVVTFCALGFFDLQSALVIFLSVMFVYETLFITVSFTVRAIKKELYTNPDVLIPLPGRRGENLGILAYLEKNTGITMRSLWSIMLIKKIIPFAVVGSAFVLWLSSGIVQIEAYQQGAHYRLGRLQSDYLQPGIHMTLPWPIDKVELYNTEAVNEITVGYLSTDATDNLWTEAHGNNEYKLLLGGGNELVSINLRVQYKIKDLGSFLKCSSSPASLLESAAYETVTNRTINTDLDSLLAADREAFSESFEKEVSERIAKYDIGLSVVDVIIESIHPPVEVAQIYQRIISAGIEAEQILLEAEGAAGVKVAEAQAEHDKNINSATEESHKKKADANASVAEFLASVENEKNYGDGYRYYKYLQALTEAYSGTKLIIVGDGIDSSSLYLGSVS